MKGLAPRFPAAWLDDLRSRADIVQIVSAYVPLKRNGRKYWGLCPFHNEKTASFSVDQESQLYYCFGCKAGGTVIQFVMDIERLPFQDAVRHLADQLHMPLPQMENDPEWQKRREKRDRLLEANREAAQFYHTALYSPAGQPVLDYLRGRGLTDQIIRKFGIGASTGNGHALMQHLGDKGFSTEEMIEAGLALQSRREDGTPAPAHDMFRSRAMFPIIDQYGNVLAFGGRSLDGSPPKYLNTADTPAFNKRKGVFAANLLRKERHLQRVILVEGYMDVVALTQFGVTGVCATLGTAFTEEQARLLRRFAPMVYLAYDGDSAGQNAILRGLDILEQEGIPARVLDFPDGLDPDEFIRRDGAEAFEALPVLRPSEYRMRRLQEAYDLSTQNGKIDYVREAVKRIASRLDPVERETVLQTLMLQTGFPREVLQEQMAGLPDAPAQQAAQPRPVRRKAPGEQVTESVRAQETLISLLATGRLKADIVTEEDFDDPVLLSLYQALRDGRSPAELVEECENDDERSRVSRLMLTPAAGSTDEMLAMAQDCVRRIRSARAADRIRELTSQLASLSGEAKMRVLAEIQQLSKAQRARPQDPVPQ